LTGAIVTAKHASTLPMCRANGIKFVLRHSVYHNPKRQRETGQVPSFLADASGF
jgi:hypothetical protein